MSSELGTCLITGASGFLGQFVAREAARRGYRVVDTGRVRLPSDDLALCVRDARPSLVIHAAGPASVAASFRDAVGDFRGAVLGTHCVLEAVRRESPGARFVHLSSAAVYGNPEALPIRETSELRPISPYGYHKRIGELLVQQYAELHGVPGASARIFSAYGPGLARQVIYDLFRRSRPGEPLRLDGTGNETRDFIHAADVARAILAIAERGACRGESYNVASGVETSLRELANAVRTLSSAGPVVFSGNTRMGDPTRWQADISALQSLNATPQVALLEGLEQVRDWCRASGSDGW